MVFEKGLIYMETSRIECQKSVLKRGAVSNTHENMKNTVSKESFKEV